jgi:hypothetical protein
MNLVILALCWGDGMGKNGIGITCTGEFRNRYRKKPSNTTKIIYYLLLKAINFDPAMGSSSGNEQELEK